MLCIRMVYSVPKCVFLQWKNIQSSVFLCFFCTASHLHPSSFLWRYFTLSSFICFLFCWVFSWAIIGNVSELVICRHFQAIFIPNIAASLLFFYGFYPSAALWFFFLKKWMGKLTSPYVFWWNLSCYYCLQLNSCSKASGIKIWDLSCLWS